MHDAAIYWLVVATGLSSVTSTILYLFQRCCGQFWGNVSSVCWQRFAASLELREDVLDQVTNLWVFPRIFQQLGLDTRKVTWKHDANAQTGDCVQWGWLRIPTKSYLLTCLALFGITHYVSLDLKRVEFVGPSAAISALVDLSNVVGTSQMTETQLQRLRDAFGMDDLWTQADTICTRWERRFVFCIHTASCLWLGRALQSGRGWVIAGMVWALLTLVWGWWWNCLLYTSDAADE